MMNPQRQMGGRKRQKLMVMVVMATMGLCIGGYIVGPPLYWHLVEIFSTLHRGTSSSYCPPCICDCSANPLLSITEGFSNNPSTGCTKHDSGLSEETERSFIDLLSEELKLKEAEATETQQRADTALLEAKKMASQYQKEADKCNMGMETCEETREMAEAELEAQRVRTAMWELRARQSGWHEGYKSAASY